jgi:phage replication O-like protein O
VGNGVGFTSFPNDIFDAVISAKLSARESRIVMAVVRYTYGYQVASREFSLGYLADLTGLHKPHVSTTLASLIDCRVLNRHVDGTIGVNEVVSDWLVDEC